MLAWYPSFFIKKSEQEDTAKMLRRYASSISAERNKWVAGMEKRETSIHDMFAISNTLGYDKAKTLRLHGVAAGLKKHLEKLLQEITKQGK